MIRILDLIGRPVLTIDEGASTGKVSGVLVNSVTGEVTALVVALNDAFEPPRAVPVALVQGVGEDAVMIENSSALVEFSQSPGLRAMGRLDSQIRGLPVVAATGKCLGHVADLLINMETGRVEAYEVAQPAGAGAVGGAGDARAEGAAGGLLPAAMVATIGRDAVIAAAGAELRRRVVGSRYGDGRVAGGERG